MGTIGYHQWGGQQTYGSAEKRFDYLKNLSFIGELMAYLNDGFYILLEGGVHKLRLNHRKIINHETKANTEKKF